MASVTLEHYRKFTQTVSSPSMMSVFVLTTANSLLFTVPADAENLRSSA